MEEENKNKMPIKLYECNIIFNRARTCCVSGHRSHTESPDETALKNAFISLINDGYDVFLDGMALGFDALCFRLLSELKKEYPIKIIACVPCPAQACGFNRKQKENYDKMLKISDETIIISPEYDGKCMRKRNDFMVENSSALVAFLRRDFGGTHYTVKKAEKEKLRIIRI